MLRRFQVDPVERLSNLRFALEVLADRSNLGLDDGRAEEIKRALMHQITKAELALRFPSAAQMERRPRKSRPPLAP
jgi:hypothetical protein